MTRWQRRARLVIGISAVAFAVVVATQFRPRSTPAEPPAVQRADPKATVESTNGEFSRVNLEHEQVRYKYDQLLRYEDGSTRMKNVTVITERAEGRTFTITANEGRVGKDELDLEMIGHVRLAADDGLVVTTEHATYTDADALVRADGALQFSKGRMTGTGLGMTYAKNTDVLSILDKATMRMPPDEKGANHVELTAGAATFTRPAHTVLFERHMKMTRDADVTETDAATAHLSADEQQIEALELRGGSRITGTRTGPGMFKMLGGQDIDVKYRADDQSIERARVNVNASIDVAGDRGQANRRIEAVTIDIGLAPDGVTPTSLAARENVRLTIPADQAGPARTIDADAMEGKGDDRQGLTSARFTGNVEFAERGSSPRTARAPALDVDMARGMGTIDEARFSRGVRFTEDTLSATAASARYVLAKSALELTGSEPGFVAPHVQNERIDIGATRIDLAFEGPVVKAVGNVGSSLRAARKGAAKNAGPDPKTPSMLKADQDVQVTARELTYDGAAGKATYDGNASLWQGDTKIKGSAIDIDDRTGDLAVRGGASTTSFVMQEKDNKKARVQSRGAGKDFKYEEALKRGTYTGDASLVGPQGDLKANVIELYLKPSGDEIDRIEGHARVRVLETERRRTATGDEMTYFSADERYIVTGKPVTIVDECGRKDEGQTLTFYRTTDRIILNGSPTSPTATRSDGTTCR